MFTPSQVAHFTVGKAFSYPSATWCWWQAFPHSANLCQALHFPLKVVVWKNEPLHIKDSETSLLLGRPAVCAEE